jgi:hypothetical protein
MRPTPSTARERTIEATRPVSPADPMRDTEPHSLRGAIDAGALYDFRTEFERLEPLARGSLDDPVNPDELRLQLDDGIAEAERAAITVRWSTRDDYDVHYSDETGRNLRWDVHPHEYTNPDADAHYHPPPNASSDDDDVAASCITVTELVLVARAVHQLWRAGYDGGTAEPLNDAINPP